MHPHAIAVTAAAESVIIEFALFVRVFAWYGRWFIARSPRHVFLANSSDTILCGVDMPSPMKRNTYFGFPPAKAHIAHIAQTADTFSDNAFMAELYHISLSPFWYNYSHSMHPFPEIDFSLPGSEEKTADFGAMSKDEWGDYALVRGVGPADCGASPRDQVISAFENLADALKDFGMDFSSVVRTWIYADGILDWYRDLNRARDAFFRANGVFDRFVPVSTGIGWSCGDGAKVVLGAFAARSRKPGALVRTPLPSPLQCPALEYGSSFSRAAELRTPGWRRVLVSGTASILPGGHEVAHVGDIDAQIGCTMRAVEAIYSSRGMSWQNVSGALVYLKHASYRAAWDRWLAAHPEFPRAHARSIVADICRPEWLFEIESDATA